MIIRRIVLILAVLLLVLGSGIVIDSKTNASKQPNIILLSIESTRVDHLSCYGYKRKTSPTIDKLASEGILFSNMFVQRGKTWPSLASIMTSSYPASNGMRDHSSVEFPPEVSLAEILKKNGYTCGAFLANAGSVKWRGFDHKVDAHKDDIKVTQAAIQWLKNNSKKRIFLWAHYWQPHHSYRPPKPYDRIFDPDYTGKMNGGTRQLMKIALEKTKLNEADLNHIISLYDGCIFFVDSQIEQLLSALKAIGMYENSLIIITSDHGEDLYQHHFYFTHAASIYGSSLHVPFIIRLPDKTPKNKRLNEVIEGLDIAPTILEAADIPVPAYFKGSSLIPLIFNKNKNNDFLYAYSEWKNKMLSIRTDKYRYIYNPTNYHPKEIKGATEDTYPVEREELYDIVNDPNELNNIIHANPGITQDLRNKLLNWENFKTWQKWDIKPGKKKLNKNVKKRLKALGYL